MKNTLLPVLLLCTFSTHAQYYYNDLIGSSDLARLMKTYTDNKVRMVTATGYDENNVKATDFAEVQEVRDNGRSLRISSRTANGYSLLTHGFDAQGRLATSVDSSSAQVSRIRYEYDANGRISSITNFTTDSAREFNQTESHLWYYASDGKASRMLRIISGSESPRPDTLEVRLIPDDQGNPGDEKTFRNGAETSVRYYYYDDQSRITDIVRYNNKLKKLLPDVMFEYDDQNRVIQKITTTSNLVTGYFIWRYLFDAKGLKTKEAMFDNNKQLRGKIEYSYTY